MRENNIILFNETHFYDAIHVLMQFQKTANLTVADMMDGRFGNSPLTRKST